MTLRLRLLALVVLVAVVASGASAWLTLQLANRELTRSAEIGEQERAQIVDRLAAYGRDHGTWEGIADEVLTLSQRFGQRIQVTTQVHEMIADSDNLAGRAGRPVTSQATLVDPRPHLRMPLVSADLTKQELEVIEQTGAEIAQYRITVRVAACMTRVGLPLRYADGPLGLPRPASSQDPAAAAAFEECRVQAAAAEPETPGPEQRALVDCVKRRMDVEGCVQRAFNDRIDDIAPVPLLLYTGALTEVSTVPEETVAGVAIGVAVLAVLGTLLLSRRVLRPIRQLTRASERLGEGDLTERVPVSGHDELAVLAAAFNRMATSIQRGEERHRRMVADVAHELRTPLSNLRGYLEALTDGVIEPDGQLFRSLHEETLLQQRIVDDLQTLALAEAGRLAYLWVRTELVELLETCVTAHHAVAVGARVGLAVESAGPVHVLADVDRLRQVVGNLVTNAVRHSPAGSCVVLTASATGDDAVIQVIDSGSGIADADLPRVFDRFWRADGARGRGTGGNGLGLAIARQIVLDHRGRIDVHSHLGAGSTFTVTLPRYADRAVTPDAACGAPPA
jgi:two-component system, OmpR family, sensor histidine kinase BaeS